MDNNSLTRSVPAFAIALAASLLWALPSNSAQEIDSIQKEFLSWSKRALHPVIGKDLGASAVDLKPMRHIAGNARIVALSESVHGAAEPLEFRNRLFKYLVEEMGFNAIAIESGIVESQGLDDYVVDGKGEFETVIKQGFSWEFDNFKPNRDLIRWVREYNARLPPGTRKVHVFGFDVPGSPGDLSAARGPDTALRATLQYLSVVDAKAAADIQSRVEKLLLPLKGTNAYGGLQQSERDSLTAAIADSISLLQRNEIDYIQRSSKHDYEWGVRAAIGARQIDAWIRHMPIGWKVSNGLEWTRDAMRTRDRLMLENVEWVLDQLGPRSRVLLFAAVAHIASTPLQFPASNTDSIPFGVYAKKRFGADMVSILNMSVGGEIAYCSAKGRGAPTQLKPPPESSVESLFSSVKIPQYFLDFRDAPPRVLHWLRETHDDWNGFGFTKIPIASAFDLVYYVSPVSSACRDYE